MCDQHPWGLATGLACTGTGQPHAHIWIATDAPDRHTSSEDDAERARG